MKKYFRPLLLIVSVVSVPIWASAANYYVDYANGSNSNAGTSTASPWKNCPGDPAATGIASAASLAGGDTVYFKGGVTYTLTGPTGIILKWNGSVNSPITYDGNSSGGWGTGKAKITDGNRSPGLFAMRATSSDMRYITIKNILFKDLGGSASLPVDKGSAVAPNSGAGIYANGKMTGVVIDNCDFSQLGYWYNQKPMSAHSIVGAGIEFDSGCSETTISNCTFSRMMIGIEGIWRSSGGNINGLNISGCTFSDSLVWCIDLPPASSGGSIDNVSIHDNKFSNYYQFDDPQWKGYGEWPHTDGIFIRTDFSPCNWGTINIWNNSFSSDVPTSGGTAAIYLTEGPSANIYNNTFLFPGKGRTIYFYNSSTPPSSQVVNIVNNTFLLDYTPGVAIESDSLSNTSITVKNNIFYDIHEGSSNNYCVYIYTRDTLNKVSFDYNLYKSMNTAGGKFFNWSNGIGQGGLDLMRTRGWELHGINADPKLTNISTSLTPLLANVNLLSGSAAAQAGTNLTNLGFPGLTSDKSGNPRPSSGAWDIGAFNGGGTSIRPPVNALINISTNP